MNDMKNLITDSNTTGENLEHGGMPSHMVQDKLKPMKSGPGCVGRLVQCQYYKKWAIIRPLNFL